MKVKKPEVASCSCGNMKVTLTKSKVVMRGGWLRQYRMAVCHECQDEIRVAPNIVIHHSNGDTHEMFT